VSEPLEVGQSADISGSKHVEESIFGGLKIVCAPATANDRSGTAGPVNPVFDQFVINMNADGLNQDKPLFERFVGFALALDNLSDPALELNGAGVKLPEAKRGFVLLPRRWVVERSFAWAIKFRRLVKDYERYAQTLAGLHVVAFACLMIRQVANLAADS